MAAIHEEALAIVKQCWKQQQRECPDVLLVGFHPSLQDVISNVLALEGRYHTTVSSKGQEALDRIALAAQAREPLAVILLNLNQRLLAMENEVFLQRLQSVLETLWPDEWVVPGIIGVTHEDTGQKELTSYEQLGVKHIIQPFRVRDFRRVMQQVV